MNEKEMSPMLRAFIKQSNIDFEENKKIDEKYSDFQNNQYEKAIKRLSCNSTLSYEESKGLNDKNQIHKNFKNYNHSLELDRLKSCDIKINSFSTEDDYLFRPVEKDGNIEFESTISIDELLDMT